MKPWKWYVAIAVLVAWPLNTGMFFHAVVATHPERDARRTLGTAVVYGAAFSLAWPIQVPMAYCLTGFAEDGVFEQREK